MKAGLEMTGRFKVSVDAPWPLDDFSYTGDIPSFPNLDLYMDESEAFTPFLLDQKAQCTGQTERVFATFPIAGVPEVLTVEVGAGISGSCASSAEGDSLSYLLDGKRASASGSQERVSIAFKRTGSRTSVTPQVDYDGTGRIKWDMIFEPAGSLVLDLGIWDYRYNLTVGSIPITILDLDKALHCSCNPTFTLETP